MQKLDGRNCLHSLKRKRPRRQNKVLARDSMTTAMPMPMAVAMPMAVVAPMPITGMATRTTRASPRLSGHLGRVGCCESGAPASPTRHTHNEVCHPTPCAAHAPRHPRPAPPTPRAAHAPRRPRPAPPTPWAAPIPRPLRMLTPLRILKHFARCGHAHAHRGSVRVALRTRLARGGRHSLTSTATTHVYTNARIHPVHMYTCISMCI